jgi:hypothetical protein
MRLTVATFISRRKTRGFLDIQFSFRELSPILCVSLLGSTPENCPQFLCLTLGVHSKGFTPILPVEGYYGLG